MNATSTIQSPRSVVALALACSTVSAASCAQTDGKEAAEPTEQTDQVPEDKKEAAERVNRGKADWSLDICERNDWYGDKSCDWFCPEDDPDCQVDPIGPDPSGEPAKYPIVLHHGFMGADTGIWSFNDVADALRDDGHTVYESEVPPFSGVDARARELADQVDQLLDETGAEKVNIVAHSMGGIDARALVAKLDYADRVASVSTIASPHRGTRIADAYLELVPDEVDDATDAIAEFAGTRYSDVADDADVRAAMESLSTDGMAAFNDDYPNAPSVYYQSWAGVSSVEGIRVDGVEAACDGKLLMHEGTMDHMDSLLWSAAAVVAGGTSLEINDGLAKARSAQWGNFQGCLPADHLDQVGQIEDEGMNENTGFDHIRFYRNLAYGLADRGF